MKTPKDMIQALLDGETLISNAGCKCKLDANGIFCTTPYYIPSVYRYSVWQIYKEPKWYENIPKGGVLCWDIGSLVIIIAYEDDSNYSYKFKISDSRWCLKPIPLTKQEIQVFLGNAHENNIEIS